MARRARLSRGRSKRMFRRGSGRLHRKNLLSANSLVSRGGLRI